MSTRIRRRRATNRHARSNALHGPGFSHRHAMPSRRARRAALRLQAKERRQWLTIGAVTICLPFALAMVAMETLH